ncbi:MAG: ABC transporter permease [Clostridiales Family XIII bacterium]|jgi:ABC-2 type transport system permease protein|nr:ABC transporter permease [Clostridiales Family XIII bacterium]
MKRIGMVFAFEYMGYLKNKTFRVTTVVLLAIIILAAFFPQIRGAFQKITSGGDDGNDMALLIVSGEAASGESTSFANADALTEITVGYEWETGDVSDDPKEAVAEEGYDVALVYDGGASYRLYGSSYDFGLYGLIEVLDSYFTNADRETALRDLSPDARSAAEQVLGITVSGEIVSVSGADAGDGADAGTNFFLSYILLYLLFMVMIMYGQFVISSVVNEKSTKAMEILITSAKPIQLMFGKVLGVGCAAMTQLLLIIAAAVAGLFLNFGNWKEQMPDIASGIESTNLSPSLVIFFLLFFAGGYLLYAFIYAGLGSTVSKIEDAGAVTTLPQIFVIIAFFISVFGMTNLDAIYVKVLSYIPFFSPFIMFARVCMGEADYLHGVIALLILAPTIILFAWLAAKIYRIGVMMYGKPLKLKEIFKIAVARR